MDLHDGSGTRERFRTYAAYLASVLGHADRVRPFEDYCVGLLSAEGRKSVEPLAAVTAPERTAAQHQSLLHLVAQAPWSDQAVLTRVRERVLRSITSKEPIQAWIGRHLRTAGESRLPHSAVNRRRVMRNRFRRGSFFDS